MGPLASWRCALYVIHSFNNIVEHDFIQRKGKPYRLSWKAHTQDVCHSLLPEGDSSCAAVCLALAAALPRAFFAASSAQVLGSACHCTCTMLGCYGAHAH